MVRIWCICLLIFSLVITSACGEEEDPGPINLEIGKEILVPWGYKLVGVSDSGHEESNPTFYCQNIQTERVYTCTDGTIGKEIIPPLGYLIVEASTYEGSSKRTFYCQLKNTYRIFVCNKK